MNSLRVIFIICFQNFRKWKTDYRLWMIAILLLIMVQIYVDDIRKISYALDTAIPIWIFPFIYSQFYTKLIYTLPVVLLFCNAPFTDENQIFIYTRCGRKKWIGGQILYIVLTSAVYYLFLFTVTLAYTIPIGEISTDWGKTLYTLANSNVASSLGFYFVDISSLIIYFFTPLQAVGFTYIVSWCSAVVIGLIIFACNMISHTKVSGTLISSLLVVVSCMVENDGWEMFLPYSPISWNTLNNIDVGNLTANPSFEYCISVYFCLIIILVTVIFLFDKKLNFDLKGQ